MMFDMFDESSAVQIKLQQLAVFNWGSFHNLHIANIDEKGTLITGDNGSGKSTLIDGLMALLMPAGKASFNIAAAQNDKTDRSLMSYIRGSFGSANDGHRFHHKSKRDKAVLSALQAVYKTDDGNHIILMALFWITGVSTDSSDIQRLYMVTHNNIALKNVIDEFHQNKQGFKKWLDNHHIKYTEKFKEYQAMYSRSLHLKANAPALLTRALGLKKVDDLTDLIRTLVLEPSDEIKEKAKEVVKEFADLKQVYERLIDIKEQLIHLEKLPKLDKQLTECKNKIDELTKIEQYLPIYLAKIQCGKLFDDKDKITQQLNHIEYDILQSEHQLTLCRENISRYELEFNQLGGDKIQQLERDIEYLNEKLSTLNKNASEYQKICQSLQLNDELNWKTFEQNHRLYFDNTKALFDEIDSQRIQYDKNLIKCAKVQDQIAELLNEIAIIEKSKSNIHPTFQSVRLRLCQALNLTDDDIPFIGELLDVKDDEKAWQGAIERALGGLTNTLLVGQTHYKKVTEWLNHTHTGLHIRVQVVKEHHQKTNLLKNGFVEKLIFKSHHFSHWLKEFLSYYDLICVETVNQAQITPFSMTIEGLIQKELGRFEKNDKHRIHDRNFWQLGFSNQSRLALLRNELKECQKQEQEFNLQLAQLLSLSKQMQDAIQQWDNLHKFEWREIDIVPIKSSRDEKQEILTRLSQSNDIEYIKKLLTAEQQKEKQCQTHYNHLIVEKGKLTQKSSDIDDKLLQIQPLSEQMIDDNYQHSLGVHYQKFAYVKNFEQIKLLCQQNLNQDIQKETERKNNTENQIRGIIVSFNAKEKWKYLTQEWRNDLSGLSDYLAHYHQLKEDKLADFEHQFQNRLNQHSSESLLGFVQSIKDTHDDIKQKIESINTVLQKTEFKANSFLRLKTKKEKYPYNIEFDKLIKEVGNAHANNELPEKRYRLLQTVVSILEKATNSATANNQESLRLLEPRYQLSFIAEEVNYNGKILDELNSSSGKSGGEKESFAGMIMAASLAYVLTPDEGDKPVYCTVFLDEAFSNTQESVSRRVLKVFKDLHIHINLITPYKNLNLAKETAGGLIICERNIEKHESRLCEITWQQLDEHLALQNKQSLNQYGIQLK